MQEMADQGRSDLDVVFTMILCTTNFFITRIARNASNKLTTQGKASYEGMFVTSGVISAKRKYVESVENQRGFVP